MKSTTQKTENNTMQKRSAFGRYRVIIIAIAFFLLFDIGVLIVNFYTSFQLKDDAIGINLSGRQRMLSQRTTKSLITVTDAQLTSFDAREELKAAAALFDSTLYGFRHGATVTGGDGEPVFLKAVTTPVALNALQEANAIWMPYYELLKPVIENTATPDQQQAALDYSLGNNIKLLSYMNDLTTDLERSADKRANFLRTVQATGIILALLNFVFILFKFIRQLRTADIAIEIANKENAEILDTVQEGLFLLRPDYTIGTQISASASKLFGEELKPDDEFLSLLAPRVSNKVLQDGAEYIKLLLSPHVKEELVKSINPLSDVEVLFENRLGAQEKHYLSFDFRRVRGDGDEIKHLLVTVQDITERINLEEKLKEERKNSQKEFSTFLKAMDADPKELLSFIDNAEKTLFKINDELRNLAEVKNITAMTSKVAEIARDMHGFKGNAATLNLDVLTDQAHRFETELKAIESGNLSASDLGDALLPLPLSLGGLLNTVTLLKGLMNIGSHAVPVTSEVGITAQPDAKKSSDDQIVIDPFAYGILNGLTQNIATDTKKNVELSIDNKAESGVLSAQISQQVREIVVQLIRNAVVHGIEDSAYRENIGKPAAGQIEVSFKHSDAQNAWELTVFDDGQGISPARLREKLRGQGNISEEELEKLSDQDIIRQIFRSGFSGSDRVTTHAGRGVGLNLVRSLVRRLPSGYLSVTTAPDDYTKFIITFQA